MTEILKLVGKFKIYKNKGSQGSLRAGRLTKKFAWVAGICQILKIYPGVTTGDGITGNRLIHIITHKFYVYVHCVAKTKIETVFIPNIKLYKNTSKNNISCITKSFGTVLLPYDLISFHRACVLFIQCFYIQQWPARTAQLFHFMPERIRKYW